MRTSASTPGQTRRQEHGGSTRTRSPVRATAEDGDGSGVRYGSPWSGGIKAGATRG
jgi:hypothetical protein